MPVRATRLAAILSLSVLGLGLMGGLAVRAEDAKPAAANDQEEKPYKIVDGKVDFGTFNGYRRFGDNCARCHGETADGSSFAPSLVERLKTFGYDHFTEVVINGKKENVGGVEYVMPSFGNNPDVAENIDDIYAWVKGRSDGAIKPGRPDHLAKDDPRNDK